MRDVERRFKSGVSTGDTELCILYGSVLLPICVCACAYVSTRGLAGRIVVFMFAGGIRGGVIMTAISFAPLSSKCGDSAIRDAERPRRLEGSSGPTAPAAGTAAARVLLRFHPTILAAVAVFLINMLILHERTGHQL